MRLIKSNHLKVFTFVREADKIWAAADKVAGNNGRPTLQMIIKPPPGEYQYKPEEISGHPSINLCLHSFDNIGSVNSSIFCLFDLLLKNPDNGMSFSTMAILVDGNQCD